MTAALGPSARAVVGTWQVPLPARVQGFVAGVLRLAAAQAAAEREAYGTTSDFARVSSAIELGIVGAGHNGAAAALFAGDDELWAAPEAFFRYLLLPGEARAAADAVMDDGHGDQLVARTFGRRVVELPLVVRVAFLLVRPDQRERWEAHLAAGDSRPALEGGALRGLRALEAGAAAWGT